MLFWRAMINTKIDVVLLCGGKGTRLRTVTHDKLPKSLYRVQDKELIRYTIDTLMVSPIVNKLIFAVDYHADKMVEWINAQQLAFQAVISERDDPTIVTALKNSLPHITSQHFVLCNTDEIRSGFDANAFLQKSLKLIQSYQAAMATARANDLYRHRVIETDNAGIITSTTLKSEKYMSSPEIEGEINTGFIVLPTSMIATLDKRYGDNWSSIIDPFIDQRKMYAIFNPGMQYFNVGTPRELHEANEFLAPTSPKPTGLA